MSAQHLRAISRTWTVMSDSAGSVRSTNPLLVLISSRWQIAAIAAIGVLLAAVHAWTSPPVFRAEVTLVPAKQDEGRSLATLTRSARRNLQRSPQFGIGP